MLAQSRFEAVLAKSTSLAALVQVAADGLTRACGAEKWSFFTYPITQYTAALHQMNRQAVLSNQDRTVVEPTVLEAVKVMERLHELITDVTRTVARKHPEAMGGSEQEAVRDALREAWELLGKGGSPVHLLPVDEETFSALRMPSIESFDNN